LSNIMNFVFIAIVGAVMVISASYSIMS